ncbi:MAG: phage portal protein, partial [Planctomycetes bacterium]|nr:phage portal protein [Planctomycetota bacterium]
TSSGESVTPVNAMALTAYYACVRALSEDEGKLPFITYERMKNGGKERAMEHGVYSLLHDSPNIEMNAKSFRETLTAHSLGWGNGYAEIEFNGAGSPIALWPIHPSRVEPKRDESGTLYYSVKTQDIATLRLLSGLKPVRVELREMLHIHGLGDNGITGFAASAIGREAIGVGLAQQKYRGAFFRNGAMPAAAYIPPKMMSDEAKTSMRNAWIERFGGAGKSQSLAVLDPGGELTTFSIDPKKAQMIEASQYTVEEIARLFRMPLQRFAQRRHTLAPNGRYTCELRGMMMVYGLTCATKIGVRCI